MGFTKRSKLFYFGFLAILIGISFKVVLNIIRTNDLSKVILSLEHLEVTYANERLQTRSAKVAVGFGGCTDYISRATSILRKMNISEPENGGHIMVKMNEINSMDDLNLVFSKFFSQGAAAERYIHNKNVFLRLVEAVKSDTNSRYFAGGNALIMGNRIATEGATVLLGAKLSDVQSNFLHPNVSYVAKASGESFEDIHLLLEYDLGEEWGNLKSPRANRFIIHRDENTPYLLGIDILKEQIQAFNPDIFVLGGLQMLDDFPFGSDEEKAAQIYKLENFLSDLPKTYPIHFEMASFVDLDLLLMLKNQVIPFADSLGFNEQELPNLLNILKYNKVISISTAYPRTSTMLDEMRQIWQYLVDKPYEQNRDYIHKRHILSRLHLHTIGYQIIMTDRRSPFWYSSRSAVAKASLVAHRHTCGIDNVDVQRSKLLMDDSFAISSLPNSPRVNFNSSDPVSCWEEREVEVCVAPVLVCTNVIRTSGGGDNISSAALINQLRIQNSSK